MGPARAGPARGDFVMRYVYLLIGLLMVAGAVGFMFYRMDQEPDLVSKYERMIQGESTVKTSEVERRTRSPSASRGGGDSESVEMFQMALDVGNLVVGLIGIFLAVSSMRGRRQTQH